MCGCAFRDQHNFAFRVVGDTNNVGVGLTSKLGHLFLH
jgi:hypothetical protein